MGPGYIPNIIQYNPIYSNIFRYIPNGHWIYSEYIPIYLEFSHSYENAKVFFFIAYLEFAEVNHFGMDRSTLRKKMKTGRTEI